MTATLTSLVTGKVETLVQNPDLSAEVYNGFTPIINSLELGFYPTPAMSDFNEYIAEVNSYEEECGPVSGYISSDHYDLSVGADGTSCVVPSDYWCSQTTTSSNVFPYYDRIHWKIK